MVEVRNLVKEFNGFHALDGVDMSVKKGAIYGLVGPNGAGKSTLLRHLTGIYRQNGGTVKIAGEEVYENPKIKEKFAFIPDDIFYAGGYDGDEAVLSGDLSKIRRKDVSQADRIFSDD